MKITRVRAVQPPTPKAPGDWRTIVGQILVAIDTDRGLTGYGVGGGGAAGTHVVNHLLAELLVGQDPAAIETHWERMYRATVPYGRKGLVVMAISGVDLALWDLRGKAENLHVARLLADKPHHRVPCYASLGTTPGSAVADGFQAVKLHLPAVNGAADVDRVARQVAEARAQIGPDIRLMTDAFMRWDVASTLELAHEFKQQSVEWIEEPLLPDDFDGYAELAARCVLPIAGGEHEYTIRGFRDLAERRIHAIWQPDITWCGGLTQMIGIYKLAAEHGATVCQHRGAEVWGLHSVAAFERDAPLAEAGRPWMDWILDQPVIENGHIEIPDRAGFGIRVDEAALP